MFLFSLSRPSLDDFINERIYGELLKLAIQGRIEERKKGGGERNIVGKERKRKEVVKERKSNKGGGERLTMFRGTDRWAAVDMTKLDPERRRVAMKLKKKVVVAQMGKTFDEPDIEISKKCVETFYIDTMDRLNAFCDEVLNELEEGPTPIILETKGDSNMWKEQRRQLDGEGMFDNGEPAGVNVMFMRLMSRRFGRYDRYACIHIGKILMNEGNGKPILPERLHAIFYDENSLWFGENISKHLLRVESSFYKELNGPKFLGLTDFVSRWYKQKYQDIKGDLFQINPFRSNGVLANYHDVFKGKTYFKNVAASASNWNSIEELDDEQIFYGLISLWAQQEMFEQVLTYYNEMGFQLSCMFTIFPRRVYDDRVDEIYQRSRVTFEETPGCFAEKKWPNMKTDGTVGCRVGFGDPTRIRELQKDEFEARWNNVPVERRVIKRRRLDSDVDEVNDREDERESQKGSL